MRVKSSDTVIILYDDTVFGGSREGFLVTTGGIYAKEFLTDPIHFEWKDIRSISFKASLLIINSCEITMPTASDTKLAQQLSKALAKLIS